MVRSGFIRHANHRQKFESSVPRTKSCECSGRCDGERCPCQRIGWPCTDRCHRSKKSGTECVNMEEETDMELDEDLRLTIQGGGGRGHKEGNEGAGENIEGRQFTAEDVDDSDTYISLSSTDED